MADLFITLSVIVKLAVCFFLALFFGFVFYVYNLHSKYSHIPGPPRSNFFFGNLLQIRKRRIEQGKNIHQSLAEWATEYRPVLVIWFFHIPLAVVSDADFVRQVLVVKDLPKDPFGYKRFQYVFGQRFLGRGLLTDLDRLTWESKRRALAPAFHRNKLINLLPTINSRCESFLQRLEDLADGKTEVAMADEISVFTLDSLLKLAFSLDMNETEFHQFRTHFHNGLNGIVLSFRSPAMEYLPWSSVRKQCIDGARASRDIVKRIVEERQKDIDAGRATPDDMLSYVFKFKDTLRDCSINDLVDMAVTFVFGGMDTMSNHMAFTLLSICLHPDVEKRLREELDEVIDGRSLVTAEDFQSLRYLDKVMKEALRLHPPTTAITRATDKDTELGGLLIPANTPLMVNPFVLHHHPNYWDNPESFQPDRFDSENKLHPYAYFPFSLGSRRCIGVQLAQLEVKLVIARLLQKFTINLLPGQSLEIAENVTFCPAGGVRCTLKPSKS